MYLTLKIQNKYVSSRAVEQELSDSNEQLSEAVVTNQAITAAKRKMEQEMSTLQVSLSISIIYSYHPSQSELDEMAHEAAMSEELAMKAMMDAARLAEELRTEQEVAMATERDRKLLEAQVKDLVARCDEAETNALKVCNDVTTRQVF